MFKKIKTFFVGLPLSERPDVPCGDKAEHYYWTDDRLMCPNCLSIKLKEKAQIQLRLDTERENERKMNEYEILSDMIAAKVLARLNDK